ncbi:MAG: hypothetical protein AAF927_20390 [Bacteroidota bacterium]
MSKHFGKRSFGKNTFNDRNDATPSGGSGGISTSGAYYPPSASDRVSLRVIGTGFDSEVGHFIDIWHNRYLAGGESYNVFLNGSLQAINLYDDKHRIIGLEPGQTYDIQVAIVSNNVQVGGSNVIKSTVARTMGDQWFQIIGFIASDPDTTSQKFKNFRWAMIKNKEAGTAFLGSYIMIRRYDTTDINGIDAERLASADFDGTMGYEVLPPTNTGNLQPQLGEFSWLVPEADGAVYRAFLMGENSAGLGSHWHPGPIFRTGESYQPGTNILGLWSTDDPGKGTVTHIRDGRRTLMPSWIDAVGTCTLPGDQLEIDGVVRTQSVEAIIQCKASGTKERPILVKGKNGPSVDSIRSAKILDGIWTSEGGGRYSIPIPVDYIIPAFPSYKANSIWCGDLPLAQAGGSSRKEDLHMDVMGYSNWNNPLYYMTSSTMTEQTFFWDGDNGKIWVFLPGGLDPSDFIIEIGWGTGVLSGVDKVNGQDVMRNYWRIENLTLAHSNFTALYGSRGSVIDTGREGWEIINCAIIGGDWLGLGHFSTHSIVDNCLIDGAQAQGMLQQNTGPDLDWVGSPNHPKMYTLVQNCTFSALNVGNKAPYNHLGKKRIPAQSHYHERRNAVIPRISNTFPNYYIKNLAMGAWYDLPSQKVIHEECFWKDLPFGIYTEIAPIEWMTDPGAWSVDNRNLVDVGFSQFFYQVDSPTNNSKSLHGFLSSSYRAMIGNCTTLGPTSCIFIGGGTRKVNEPNFSTTTGAIDCAAHGNILQVKEDEWANIHIQDLGLSTLRPSVDDNYHVDSWSGSFGFNFSDDRAAFEKAGFSLRDKVGRPIFRDAKNDDYRVSGGSEDAEKYGASVPAPLPIRYS